MKLCVERRRWKNFSRDQKRKSFGGILRSLKKGVSLGSNPGTLGGGLWLSIIKNYFGASALSFTFTFNIRIARLSNLAAFIFNDNLNAVK